MLTVFLVFCIAATSAKQIGSFDKIINGEDVQVGDHPYQVILRANGRLICGGSIISPNHVLTAAHCVSDRRAWRRYTWDVVVGVHNTTSITTDPAIQIINVESRTIHPRYGKGQGFAPNDVAVLKLSSPVGDRSIPIAEDNMNFEGGNCLISGFGDTEDGSLAVFNQETRGDILTFEECTAWWGTSVLESMLCIQNTTSGSCNGDSGGPMVCQHNGNDFLAGLTSWGTSDCSSTQVPSVYTKVSSFANWINEILLS